MDRGIKVTEQMKAEKLRKKIKQAEDSGPGTIRYGLVHKQSVKDFMKDAYDRRKTMRDVKKK